MLPFSLDSSSEFELGKAVGAQLERQRLAAYVHEELAPELMAVAFSLEAIRAKFGSKNLGAQAELKELEARLTELIQRFQRGRDLDRSKGDR